jgi:hypothetical protein
MRLQPRIFPVTEQMRFIPFFRRSEVVKVFWFLLSPYSLIGICSTVQNCTFCWLRGGMRYQKAGGPLHLRYASWTPRNGSIMWAKRRSCPLVFFNVVIIQGFCPFLCRKSFQVEVGRPLPNVVNLYRWCGFRDEKCLIPMKRPLCILFVLGMDVILYSVEW